MRKGMICNGTVILTAEVSSATKTNGARSLNGWKNKFKPLILSLDKLSLLPELNTKIVLDIRILGKLISLLKNTFQKEETWKYREYVRYKK